MKEPWGAVLLLAALSPAPAFPAAAEEPTETPITMPADDMVAYVKSLPEPELKQFYRRCTRASVRGHLGAGEIAICSIAYEQLLQRHFGGDFRALLAWRRGPEGEAETRRSSPF